jgi:hypothetical protein
VGESYDDDDLQVDGDWVWGYSDEGCDRNRGRCWGRGDLYASPGWAYGDETGDRGCRYGDADSDAHAYHWYHSDCGADAAASHGYDRVDDGGRAANQRLRQEHRERLYQEKGRV